MNEDQLQVVTRAMRCAASEADAVALLRQALETARQAYQGAYGRRRNVERVYETRIDCGVERPRRAA